MRNLLRTRSLIAALAAALLPAAAAAQASTGAAAAAGDVEHGRALFLRNGCHACHGTVGQGGERSGAPRLAPEPLPFEAFRALVRTPREAMPRFDPQYVSDDDLRAMHRYLQSVPRGRAAKDIPALQLPGS